MYRFTLPHLLILAAMPLLCATFAVHADKDDASRSDLITAAVVRAEAQFNQSVASAKLELNNDIARIMERQIQLAINKGDLDALESLQKQLKAYETNGVYPDAPPIRAQVDQYKKQLARYGDTLLAAYDAAIRGYTQARDVPNARLTQDKREWTRPTISLETLEYRGHLYYLFLNQKNWTEAQTHCDSLGGYLVCLNNQAEHQFIIQKVLAKKKIIIWVGATDVHAEGDWQWLNGSNDYWPWRKGDPNNASNKEHHAGHDRRNRLVDMVHDHKQVAGYICEWTHTPTRETIYKPKKED